MKTITEKNNQRTLITEALQALIKNLGPRKTAELWRLLTVPRGDYAQIRHKLFTNLDAQTIYKVARRFNRK